MVALLKRSSFKECLVSARTNNPFYDLRGSKLEV
jgi:hypothetical protein